MEKEATARGSAGCPYSRSEGGSEEVCSRLAGGRCAAWWEVCSRLAGGRCVTWRVVCSRLAGGRCVAWWEVCSMAGGV